MKRLAGIILSVTLVSACSCFAKDTSGANPFSATLAAVPAAELPAKAADMVSQAKPKDRKTTTIGVVKAAVDINPAAAPAIVGAIAQAVPKMASIAAAVAAEKQPKQASLIAKAAAAAAPSQVGPIVTAVCRVAPKDYWDIAVAVSQVVPNANKEIVKAVESALPELKPSVDKVVTGYAGNVVSVGDTLTQASQVAKIQSQTEPVSTTLSATPATIVVRGARGPAVGAPYVPLTQTPTNVTADTSSPVPDGGRNYAKP